jgi:cytochrome c
MYKAVVAFTLGMAVAGSAFAADANAGKEVFTKKCAMCHSVEAGKNKMGPSLAGVVGRKAGTAPDYNYSDAMKGYGKEWTAETLEPWLTDPKATVPGTKMVFAGLKNKDDRDNVIAYLETLK